jgi:hypothetical protein
VVAAVTDPKVGTQQDPGATVKTDVLDQQQALGCKRAGRGTWRISPLGFEGTAVRTILAIACWPCGDGGPVPRSSG